MLKSTNTAKFEETNVFFHLSPSLNEQIHAILADTANSRHIARLLKHVGVEGRGGGLETISIVGK